MARQGTGHALGWLVRGTTRAEPARASLRLLNASWIAVLAGIALSLVGVYAIDLAETVRPESAMDLAPAAWKQVIFMTVGMIAAVLVALPHYRIVGWFAWPAFAIALCVLVFVLVPVVPDWLVRPRNGARAWINIGPFVFQPSEVAKIAYVLAVAHYLRYRHQHRELVGLVVPGVITAIPVGLITLQPDLGTASLFVPALFAMLIAAGARLRHLTIIVVCAALAAPAAYPFLQHHQKQRLIGLVKQIEGDRTTAYDINFQSFTAQTLIGAGGTDGMPSPASRAMVYYNRLPERHNDMIFAVIVNRFGLLGGLGVMALYLVWISAALLVAAMCRDPLGRLICVGLPAFVAAQMVVNIGMNVGLLPIIGITLPFLSYGGSSMLTCWLMTGLVANVALHRPRPPYRDSFEYADGDDGRPFRPANAYGKAIAFSGRATTREV